MPTIAADYCIALNYGMDVYFFPVIFNQATKWDRCLLVEDSCAVIIGDASDKFWGKLMMHEALYYELYYVIACHTLATKGDPALIYETGRNLRQYSVCVGSYF